VKKFFISVVVGIFVGGILAWAFLFVVPKLPDIFANLFYYPQSKAVTVIQDVQKIFKPDASQYFIQSVDDSVGTSTKVVYADLGAMTISLYENGQVVQELPIQSVGREGTAWQTPLGTFDMNYKEQNHFSSLGHVWMPYSMQFFGNYFIHGWPYYSDGTPVPKGYSGGCIRLNTPDSEIVYNFVDKDTRLIVTTNKKPEIQKDFQYVVQESVPQINSAYLVADINTGEVISSNKANIAQPTRSFAKLMTGLISLETLNQYQETVLNQDIVKVSDVLYALLLADNDEAGRLLYEHKNKAQYLRDMNTRADSLAMNQTQYEDTNGLSDSTVSSLEDTFKLLQYVHSYKPFMLKVLSLDSYSFGSLTQTSLNPLQKQEGYVAGFADNKKTEMITIMAIDVKGESTLTPIQKKFAILVQSDSDGNTEEETKKIYEWITNSVVVRENK
jgi:hypothetical protein